MRTWLTVLVVSVLSLWPLVTEAAVFEQERSLVSISETVADDVYAIGQRVVASERVSGDLWFLGQKMKMTGVIQEGMTGMAREVTIEGDVTDDVRVVASNVTINGTIQGDAVIIARKLRVRDGAKITGEGLIAARETVINGTIEQGVNTRGDYVSIQGDVGSSQVTANRLKIGGFIDGDMQAMTTLLPTVQDEASITGDVTYWTGSKSPGYAEATDGAVSYDADLRDTVSGWDLIWQMNEQWVQWTQWGSAVFTMLVLMVLVSPIFARAGHLMRPEHWPEHRYGAAFGIIVGMPLVAGIFAFSILGLPIAAFLMMLYVFGYLFLWPISSLVLAFWVNEQGKLELQKPIIFLLAMFFYTFLNVLAMTPALRWIVWIVFFVVLAALSLTLVPRLTLISEGGEENG
jgi:hypothetical protein